MAKDILKEAIADAKAVREVALANAKAALEEAFTPKLQSMLSAKLSEELDSGEETELDEVQSLAIDAAGSFDKTPSYGSKSDDPTNFLRNKDKEKIDFKKGTKFKLPLDLVKK